MAHKNCWGMSFNLSSLAACRRTPNLSRVSAVAFLNLPLRYASDAYRVVLAVQIGTRIYVLHAFQKESKKGVETPKRDVDLIKKRYIEAQELAYEHEKTKTN